MKAMYTKYDKLVLEQERAVVKFNTCRSIRRYEMLVA